MKHRVSARPPQLEIKAAIIQVRVLTYMRTTRHSIRNLDEILWSFPERYNAPRNNPAGKWEWSQVKRIISNFMASPKMKKEWYLSSSGQWTRIKPVGSQPVREEASV
jgi:hypothetical protein